MDRKLGTYEISRNSEKPQNFIEINKFKNFRKLLKFKNFGVSIFFQIS